MTDRTHAPFLSPAVSSAACLPVLPGGTLGVLGGGQLGQMFVHAAQAAGYRTVVLDPDASSPAGLVSHQHIQADYTDASALVQLSRACDAITTEFENVPATSLAALAKVRPVAPPAVAVSIAQNRAAEKVHFSHHGVPCAPFAVIDSADALAKVGPTLFPGILKTSRLGYDGKGQVSVARRDDLAAAWEQLGQVDCVLEQRLPLDFECSVIVARSADGSIVHLPVQRNLHHNGILAVTEVLPGGIAADVAEQAIDAAYTIARATEYVGVLCVEFFVLEDGRLVANEMAPRPHNSGHYSQDACDLSQFDLQVRALAGLPLVPPRQHSSAIMLNLLGDLWFAPDDAQGTTPTTPNWAAILALPGVHLHLYGKTQARRGRKMGHINITAREATQVLNTAREVAQILGLPADF